MPSLSQKTVVVVLPVLITSLSAVAVAYVQQMRNAGSAPPAPGSEITITGRIANDGDGVEGAEIVLQRPEEKIATTGQDGRFSFEDLPEGSYRIVVRHPQSTQSPPSLLIFPDDRPELIRVESWEVEYRVVRP